MKVFKFSIFPVILALITLAATGCFREQPTVIKDTDTNANAGAEELTFALIDDQGDNIYLLGEDGTEETSLDLNYQAFSFQFANDQAYYYNMEETQVEGVDREGVITPLAATKSSADRYYGEFLIADEGQKIFWSETEVATGGAQSTSTLYAADTDGGNKQEVVTSTNELERYYQPLYYDPELETVYYSLMPGGIGGYILFPFYMNLGATGLDDGETVARGPQDQMIAGIAPDFSRVYYFESAEGGGISKLISQSLMTGVKDEVDLPAGYTQGGDFHYNEAGDRVAFTLAVGDVEKEQMATFVFDPVTLVLETIVEKSSDNFQVKDWLPDGRLVLVAYGNYGGQATGDEAAGTYLIKSDGTGLEEFSPYNFVGLWQK